MKFRAGEKVVVVRTKEIGSIYYIDAGTHDPTWYQVMLHPKGENPYFSWYREYELAFPRNGLDFVFDYLDAKGL